MINFDALFSLTYGIYLITSREGGRNCGCLVNTVFQLTAEPVRVGVSVAKANQTHDAISQSGVLTVSVVGEQAPDSLLGVFGYRSGRDCDKFDDRIHWKYDSLNNPAVEEGAVALIGCKVEQEVDMDTHTMFVCSVEYAKPLTSDKPMTYSYYREVKKLKSSKFAPTYVGNTK